MFDGLPKLEEIGYDFKKKELLLEALTHRSYSVEKGFNYDNQRLEFLGDAVLQLTLSHLLFQRLPQAYVAIVTTFGNP